MWRRYSLKRESTNRRSSQYARLRLNLSSDNDPQLLFHRWQANLRILGVAQIKSIPYTPTSHPLIERLIGYHVVERFVVNTLIVSSFGINEICSASSNHSLSTTINIGLTHRWRQSHLSVQTMMLTPNAQISGVRRGSHTARGFLTLHFILSFWIRPAQATLH